MMRSNFANLRLLAAALILLGAATPAFAQKATLPDLLGQAGDAAPAGDLQIDATLTAARIAPGEEAVLAITVKLPRNYYIYSTSPDFSGRTKLTVEPTADLAPLDDEFSADRPPKVVLEPILKQEVEKFHDQVTWFRRFRITENADLDNIAATATLLGNYCSSGPNGNCIPIRPARKLTAKLVAGEPPEAIRKLVQSSTRQPFAVKATPTRKAGKTERADPISFVFDLSPTDAKPGDEVTLAITANIEKDWHTFSLTQDPKNSGLPTKIVLEGLSGLEPIAAGFIASEEPHDETTFDGKQQLTHYGSITWSRKFTVSDEAAPGEYGVRGRITAQICREGQCLPPRPVEFALGDLTNQTVPATEAASLSLETFSAQEDSAAADSLPLYLAYAFLGGLILNIMPCVLPVLAIKVMSFVQQAGESRGRILALNVAYSVGVISVFLLLATLAVVMGIGWGGLFQRPEFNLVMACVVFAMGLSLLGVFEIPVPGVIGSAAGGAHREGLLGAFLTGILATLLATPCSGPFLGATLAWSVKQAASVTFLVWAVMGLGMASPYLLFGLFPGAIRFLPRPGNWMVRFKEFSGFVLMATVIFILSFLDADYTIPALVLMMGIALGLWMVGHLYDMNSTARQKWTVRIWAAGLMLLIGGLGFGLSPTGKPYLVRAVNVALGGGSEASELPWKPFSENELKAQLAGSKTVLVDFTADWCLTCKTNEALALNTAETLKLIEQHGVVPLYADYTNESDEIKRWLDKFESISVPLTVIFPAGSPDRPIVIRDLYSQQTLLEKLQQAVNTQPAAAALPKPQVVLN